MIVMRYSFQIKSGKFQQAIELAKEGKENVWSKVPGRIYSTNIGSLNTIVFETEYKDNAEREKLSGETANSEEWVTWVASWSQVTSGEGTIELWNLN